VPSLANARDGQPDGQGLAAPASSRYQLFGAHLSGPAAAEDNSAAASPTRYPRAQAAERLASSHSRASGERRVHVGDVAAGSTEKKPAGA